MNPGTPPADSALVYGIDIGDWDCTVAVSRVTGTAIDAVAALAVPAAVGVAVDGRPLAGEAAYQQLRHDPGRYRRGLVDVFGQQRHIWLADGPVDTGELMALLLAQARTAAQAAVAGAPDRVAMAVPSGWGQARRDALLAAAAAAGFDRQRTVVVDRPVAAARLAADRLTGERQRHLLVYDLGAGGFTASLLRRTGAGRLIQLGQDATRGDLGAAAFDRALLDAMAERSAAVAALLDNPAPDVDEQHRIAGLHALAETVKRQLSARRQVSGYVTLVQPGFAFEIDRAAFDEAIRLTVAATVATAESLLEQHDLTWSAVDVVVPAGGGANIPLVARELGAAWGREVDAPAEPELLAARGAAHEVATGIRVRNERRGAAIAEDARRPVPLTGAAARHWATASTLVVALVAWAGWAASGGWFTLTHWHGPWAWATLASGIAIALLVVAGYLAGRSGLVGTAIAACVAAGGVHLVTLVICAYRAIFAHVHVGWVAFVCTGGAVLATVALGFVAFVMTDEISFASPGRTWVAGQRRLARRVVEGRESGAGTLPDFARRLVAEYPATRAFTPTEGPFDVAIVRGRTLVLCSTAAGDRPSAEAMAAAVRAYLGKPASAPKIGTFGARFAGRQINVHCFLVGELSADAENYAAQAATALPNSTTTDPQTGQPAVSSTLAVVPGGDVGTRLARLLERADREYYSPLLERAAQAAGLA